MATPADRVADLYEHKAADWDADRRRARPEGEGRWIARFVEMAGPDAEVLDLGCGSGEPIAADLVAAGLGVTGVDASPSLIALCRERFPAQHWVVADMRRLALERRYGGAVVWHSLFHLPPEDQAAMFPAFAQHLAPGAPLLFTSGTTRGETLGAWRGEPLYHASLDTETYADLLVRNGFSVIDHVVGDPLCGGANIWLARREDR
jgi:SAM-dependent methyltransferase